MALSDQYAMDGASIITFLIGLVLVFDPARHVAQFLTQLQSSLILLESVRSIFDVAGEDLHSGKSISNKSEPITVKFTDVSFSYKEDQKILDHISMEFKAGTKNAIVGATGSGKTTVLSLLGNLYLIDKGKITFDNQDITELSLASLRDQISIVSQDIVILISRWRIIFATPNLRLTI